MKIILFVIILFFCSLEDSQEDVRPVVNSCGSSHYKTSKEQPTEQFDCKDPDEPACKLIKITKNYTQISFCGVVHGKYNDVEVINDVKNLIKVDELEVLKGNIIKTKFIFKFLFIIMILL